MDLPEYVNLVYINDEEKVRQGLRDQNALVEAAASNDMKGVSSALALGVDINGQDDNGQTALFSAAAYGHKSLAMFLLNEGAHINTCERNGQTALHAACMNAQLEMVRFLLTSGADVGAADAEGRSPLHRCVGGSEHAMEMIELLAEHGADLRCRDNASWDLLMYASRLGREDLVRYFALHVNPNYKTVRTGNVLLSLNLVSLLIASHRRPEICRRTRWRTRP